VYRLRERPARSLAGEFAPPSAEKPPVRVRIYRTADGDQLTIRENLEQVRQKIEAAARPRLQKTEEIL